MPLVKTASDLQRNISEVYDLCEKTKEPVYITRNGEASLVVMDAQAFDDAMAFRNISLEYDAQRSRAIEHAQEQVTQGEFVTLDEAREEREARVGR